MNHILDIPGNYLEGGGQIIRTSLVLSSMTNIPFFAEDIRKGRPKPGLKSQHLYSLKALESICSAKTKDVFLGSEKFTYIPSDIKPGNYTINLNTAGSISLSLQAVLPVLMFSKKTSTLEVIGGTHGLWSPPIEYFQEILLPQLRRFADIDFSLMKRGYFPKGGGVIKLRVRPKHHIDKILESGCVKDALPIINLLDPGKLVKIKGISHASLDLEKAEVAERQKRSAELLLKNRCDCPVDISVHYSETFCSGSGITLWAEFSIDKDEIDINNPIRLGADFLGNKGLKSEYVGIKAAENLIAELENKVCVDKYLADQILIFMALTKGSSIKTSFITDHTKTNIFIIEKFLGKKFSVDYNDNTISTLD